MSGIVLDSVAKVFPNGVRAVDSVSLTISDGEFMVLVGPSGCGKSTLLRMIAGLEDVSEGDITLGDRVITEVPARQRNISMVFQNYALYPHMTVRENLGFGMKLRRVPRKELKAKVDDVAKIVGLDALLDRKPSQLSGGQRQRVAIGRAMVRRPDAYLMDEPLSNLDAKLRVAMRAELAKLRERLGVTTVYVTHDQVEAMTLGDRVAVMRDGVLQQVASPQELYRHPVNLFVAAFIGSPTINLVEADISDGAASFAGISLPAHTSLPASGQVVLGIRPTDFTLVSGEREAGSDHVSRMRVVVDVVENLGAQQNVFFHLDAPRVLVDAVRSVTDGEDTQLLADDRTMWVAVTDDQVIVHPGDTLELGVRLDRVHAFDRATGASLTTAAETSGSTAT